MTAVTDSEARIEPGEAQFCSRCGCPDCQQRRQDEAIKTALTTDAQARCWSCSCGWIGCYTRAELAEHGEPPECQKCCRERLEECDPPRRLAATPSAPPADLEAESRELLADVRRVMVHRGLSLRDAAPEIGIGFSTLGRALRVGSMIPRTAGKLRRWIETNALSARQIAQGAKGRVEISRDDPDYARLKLSLSAECVAELERMENDRITGLAALGNVPLGSASPPPSEEADAMVERLRRRKGGWKNNFTYAEGCGDLVNPDGPDAAALITRLGGGEVERLREALERIAVGDEPRPIGKQWRNDGKPSKNDKCTHDVWMYETCGNCVSECARTALQGESRD